MHCPLRGGLCIRPNTMQNVQDAQDREGGKSKKASKGAQEREAAVRWYDSRARVSLRRMAAWLLVPWDRVATYECLLAEAANQVLCNPMWDAFACTGCERHGWKLRWQSMQPEITSGYE